MEEKLKEVLDIIINNPVGRPIKVISHFDADGITSAAIFSRALNRLDKSFSLEIVKSLDKNFLESQHQEALLILLDLGSGSLETLAKRNNSVIILDHHEIPDTIPSNIHMVNPILFKQENCSAAAICYAFAKVADEKNKDLANLAIVGMVGDQMEKNISPAYDAIIKDGEITIKKGPILYPATRPLERTLEFSSGLYIPGVTGSFKGVMEILREAGIEKGPNGYKSMVELTEKEMSGLITAIALRKKIEDINEIVGNIYLTKFFNQMEDAREMSALINSCSRMGCPHVALNFCMGNKKSRKDAEKIYATYKQSISSALKYIESTEKIIGQSYMIINAKNNIQDTIIGTVTSIMSYSSTYKEGTVLIGMAYDKNNVKISARLAGKKGRNVREVLVKATSKMSCEVGGHPNAAGALIPKEKEEEFIKEIAKVLEYEVVKIA